MTKKGQKFGLKMGNCLGLYQGIYITGMVTQAKTVHQFYT